MSITIASEETVFQGIMGFYTAQFPDQDLSEKSFFGLFARAQSQAIMLYLKIVEQADNDATPAYKQDADGTVLSKCSTEALDAWAITYGLPSGTAGIYGRKGATGSSGGVGLPTCSVNGTLISAGSQLTDSTGQVTVETVADVTTNGPPNTLTVTLVSVTTGLAANLPVGSVLTFVSPPANVSSTLALTSALTGGAERETDGALLARILFRLQNPPRGGTAADYRYWAESSVDLANNNAALDIIRAYVYPLRSGLGSVDVVVTRAGSGTTRDPGATITALVQTYLNSVRPVTATVTALRPSMPTGRALKIRILLSPYEKFAYDWDDGGAQTGIFSATSTTLVVQSIALPAALSAASAAGKLPRIQIRNTSAGASPKPYVRNVTRIQPDVPIVGQSTLTLGAAVTPTPAAGADYFIAGGPVVDTIASAILAYVDGLGPSRSSGYADVYDVWESDVTIARLIDIAMEARDSDGTRMIRNIPNIASVGVTIAIGAGAYTSTDFTPRDVVGSVEMAHLAAGGIELYTR